MSGDRPRRGGLPAPAWVLAGVAALALLLCVSTLPDFLYMGWRAKRAEAARYTEGIKTALLGYDAAFGGFVYCGSRNAARAALSKLQHDWIGAGDPCWETLGWRPDGRVACEYWIEDTTLEPELPEFRVHGICDLDGNGEIAEYTLTRTGELTLETPALEF